LNRDPLFRERWPRSTSRTPRNLGLRKKFRAGHELNSAANDVDLASAWAGRKLDAATAAAIKDARAVAAKLTEDAGWTTGEVSKELDAVGKQIEKLGKQI
jgi:hypothetical protein